MILWEILIGFLIVRVVQIARGGNRQLPGEAFVAAWCLLVVLTFVMAVGVLLGQYLLAPPLAFGLVALMPWTVTRFALIPLGLVGPSRWCSSLAGWTWNHDRRGGGLVAAAWALSRKRPSHPALPALIERVDDALRSATGAMQASQVLAAGLLAATRGDQASARAMLESVDEIGPNTTPRTVHALAREWLVADAAARGDWERVTELARGPRARTRATRLLGAVGARLSGGRGAGRWLWLRWLLSPRRRHTWTLVREAARRAPAGPRGAIHRQLTTKLPGQPWSDALAAHVAVLSGTSAAAPAQALRCLAQAWDAALDDRDTRRLVLERAAALGAKSGDRALDAFTLDVARDLADMALAHHLPVASWSQGSRTLREAERLLRNQLLSEVELAFDALDDRISDRRGLHLLDEWREWMSLRALHARAVAMGGLDLRRLVFPRVHMVSCRLAVWMWNERKEFYAANAMFRWLLDEALRVGDAEAIELQRRNWDEAF
ncbi:hypothetical protein [Haliangium sp.]|uniref:hypothetical protein n=1 Tax=Haliangium sp. TaxID=2663208 RepID=UPI003D1240C7